MVGDGEGVSRTHRFFSPVVNAVGTAVVVTGEKLDRQCEVETGLRFGNEVGVAGNDRAGFFI